MKPVNTAGYWAGVLGTAMFFMGVFGAAFGWTTISVGNELNNLAGQLHDHRIGIAIGGVVHAMTIGVMNLSGVETAEAARKLLEVMPSPYFLQIMGSIRMGISLIAIIIGIFMVMRRPWTVPMAAVWAIVTTAWFFLATWKSLAVLKESLGHPLTGGNTPIFIADALFHLIWPVFLMCWLIPAWRRGEPRKWREQRKALKKQQKLAMNPV